MEWQDHLTTHFSIPWARRVISQTISDGISHADRRLGATPEGIYSWTAGNRRIHLDAAMLAIPGLLADLPSHDPAARTLRTIGARATSPQTLQDWVDELVALYGRLTGRLLRCRNSLAHGGPLSEDTGANSRRLGLERGQTHRQSRPMGCSGGQHVNASAPRPRTKTPAVA